ncbi:hypothetical protein KL938_002322 [Ogataea parapolymorpha]|nr:hypothetical protein KL938_002322 [Ogataea parapolymorpha]
MLRHCIPRTVLCRPRLLFVRYLSERVDEADMVNGDEASPHAFDEPLPWEKLPEEEHIILKPTAQKKSKLTNIKETLESGRSGRSERSKKRLDMIEFEKGLKNLMVFKIPSTDNQLFKDLDNLQPRNSTISAKSHAELETKLVKGYQKAQLLEYIGYKHVSPPAAKSTKKNLAQYIIQKCWDVAISEDSPVEVLKQAEITLQSKKEAFLLLSHSGYLMQSWTRLGARLELNRGLSRLTVRGNQALVNFVQASWNYLLNHVSTSVAHLNELASFYTDKLHRQMPIAELQKLSNVYFEEINKQDKLFQLSTFNPANLQLAKSLLLAATDFSATSHKHIDVSGASTEHLKLYQDSSLPWWAAGPLYRYELPQKRVQESSFEQNFDPESLAKEVDQLRSEVAEAAEKFQYNFLDQKQETKPFSQAEISVHDSSAPWLAKSREIYSKLTPEVQRDELWLPRTFNATFGKLLFNENAASAGLFHANLPQINKKIGMLNLYDKNARFFGFAGGIKNNFEHSLQVKLVPDAYGKFDNFITLPNVEIWFQISKNKVDLSSCSIYVNENEVNCALALPELHNDVMFQSTCNSVLLDGSDPYDPGLPSQRPLQNVINSLSSNMLDMSDTSALNQLVNTLVSRKIPIRLAKDQEPANYLVTAINRRRSIELDFDGCHLMYDVVSNGKNERFEASLLAPETEPEMDAASFERFAKTVNRFLLYIQ